MSVADILLALIQLAVPAFVGYLAMQAAKQIARIDALPSVVKQIIMFAYGLVVAFAEGKIPGLDLPDLLADLGNPTILGGVLITLLSFVVHAVFKPKPAPA